jgi:tetratricopeptide (TPR) repeat protein
VEGRAQQGRRLSTDARAWRAAGIEALRRGKPAQALRAFERSLALGGDAGLLAVLSARARAEQGDRDRALAELSELGRTSHTEARVEAARELAFLGSVPEAWSIAASVLAESPDHRAALEVSIDVSKIGWVHEAAGALSRMIEVARGDASLHLRAAAFHEANADHDRALHHAAAALAADPRLLDAWILRARCAAAADRRDDALAAAARAETLASDRSSRLREIALIRLAAGDPAGAERTLRLARERAPRDLDTIAWLAELALHRAALDDAERLANEVLVLSPDHPRARSVLGGARVLRGDPAGAIPELERAADADDAIAQHWLGEALRRAGRYDDAVKALDLAVVRSSGYAVTAHGNRLLTLIESDPSAEGPIDPDAYAELVTALTPLAGPPSEAALAGNAPAVGAHLRAAIDALGGNRTDLPTRLEGGELVSVPVRPSSRTASRLQQEKLRSRPVDEVLDGFDALLATYGDLPTIHCHRGEVLLWLGRNVDAARCFERALSIAKTTRWAWIGLGASALMARDLDAATRAFDDALVHAAPAGRTIHVYRGELAFLRGDLRTARADLERALEINPERLSASLLLGLTVSAAGRAEAGRERIERARRAAPGLFWDVARSSSVRSPEADARAALALMRGNRSAGLVTYFTSEGRLRFVPTVRPEALDERS